MPSRDFTATGLPLRERDAARLATIEEEGPHSLTIREEEPTRVATYVEDEDLFLAGINLEEDEGSDPEELRFSLEDVGVSYEDREFSLVGRELRGQLQWIRVLANRVGGGGGLLQVVS
eukprot:g10946.t1